MKIKIRFPKDRMKKDGKKHGLRLSFALPNFLLKSKFAFKMIKRDIERRQKENPEKLPVISPDSVDRALIKKAYSALKTVIKNNGHFVLVEFRSADGTVVFIKV